MAHSYVCCLVHVVFSTAQRRPMIREDLQKELHPYLGGIARQNGISALAIGGARDHVHLLLSLPAAISVAKAVQLLKSGSSKWVHDTFPQLKSFGWQEGYSAFSIGVSQQAPTLRYIENQAEHHKRISFADELQKFLSVHGIEDRLTDPTQD
jgi:putative transposase